eukprot:scaffold503_cov365-Prasinococcus_capsulatus_cf.AAC.11
MLEHRLGSMSKVFRGCANVGRCGSVCGPPNVCCREPIVDLHVKLSALFIVLRGCSASAGTHSGFHTEPFRSACRSLRKGHTRNPLWLCALAIRCCTSSRSSTTARDHLDEQPAGPRTPTYLEQRLHLGTHERNVDVGGLHLQAETRRVGLRRQRRRLDRRGWWRGAARLRATPGASARPIAQGGIGVAVAVAAAVVAAVAARAVAASPLSAVAGNPMPVLVPDVAGAARVSPLCTWEEAAAEHLQQVAAGAGAAPILRWQQ